MTKPNTPAPAGANQPPPDGWERVIADHCHVPPAFIAELTAAGTLSGGRREIRFEYPPNPSRDYPAVAYVRPIINQQPGRGHWQPPGLTAERPPGLPSPYTRLWFPHPPPPGWTGVGGLILVEGQTDGILAAHLAAHAPPPPGGGRWAVAATGGGRTRPPDLPRLFQQIPDGQILILPDDDDTGQAWADHTARTLEAISHPSWHIRQVPGGNDLRAAAAALPAGVPPADIWETIIAQAAPVMGRQTGEPFGPIPPPPIASDAETQPEAEHPSRTRPRPRTESAQHPDIDWDNATKTAAARLPELLTAIGAKPARAGGWHCPQPGHAHGDRNASLSADTARGLYNCHGCGWSGNAFELFRDNHHRGDPVAAAYDLLNITDPRQTKTRTSGGPGGNGNTTPPEPPPAPDWSPGQPIPIGTRTRTVEDIAAWQAPQHPSKDSIQSWAITNRLWDSIQQPGPDEEGSRFAKGTMHTILAAAYDRWRHQNRQHQQQTTSDDSGPDAITYAQRIRQTLITCPDIHGQIWQYNPATGSFTHQRGDEAVTRQIEKLAAEQNHNISMGLIRTVLTLIKSRPETINFENPHLLAMTNGVLNLKTEQLHPHSPDHLLPTHIPVAYNPDAGWDKWAEFITEIIPLTQDHPIIQQFAGACLADRRPPKGAIFVEGPHNSGKTVLFNILIALLGIWNVISIEPQALTQNHMTAALRGKKANLVSDMSIEAMKDPARWKQLTGEDPILFNPKYKTPEVGYITCPSGYAVNKIPMSYDRTGAVAIRRYILKTAGTIPPENRNPQLAQQLAKNLPGIFNWAYQGYKDLTNNGWQWPLTAHQQTQQTTAILLENPIKRWAAEETIHAPGQHIKTTDAIHHHIEWLITQKLHDKPDNRIDKDGHIIPGQPRLRQPERNRILTELDNLWGQRTRHGAEGWRWPNRQIITYNPTTPPAAENAALPENDPEYDQW